MPGLFKNRPELFFYCTLLICFILGLYNLHVLPIAWTDEIMNLDPALQWHKHGKFAGFLWPNSGSDKLFLSYPPLIEWFHIAVLYVLPFDIFWVRLPFLILHLSTAWLLYRVLIQFAKGTGILALFLSLLFLFDKVVFEISRSMRVEVLETFLVVLLIYLHQRGSRPWKRGLVLGLLVVAHLKMWPLVVLYLANEFFGKEKQGRAGILILFAVIPLFLFAAGVGFPLKDWYGQMFVQVGKHSASGGIFQKIADHFINRFWPVYKEQPWAILMAAGMFFVAVKQLWERRGKQVIALLFAGTSVAWMFLLAPHYRYWPPLFLCGLVVLASEPGIQRLFQKPRLNIALILFLPLLVSGFFLRHALAIYQRAERNPYAALHWLSTAIDTNKKTLIVGEGIAFYFCKQSNQDYGMEMYPQNLHPGNYDKVYFLSRTKTKLEIHSVYPIIPEKIPTAIQGFVRGETYAGMKLYEIRNKEEWENLTGKYQLDYLNQ